MLSIRKAHRACAGAAILIGCAVPAFAHVFAKPDSARAGSDFTAGFAIGHGCSGSPTVALRLKIPAGVTAVRPQPKPGWVILQTADQIEWRGGPLAADRLDTFTVDMKMPAAAGTVLYFPAEQECRNGIKNWNEIPAAGQNRKDLKSPAPALEVTP
jgi:uncharacterized protein YcnI